MIDGSITAPLRAGFLAVSAYDCTHRGTLPLEKVEPALVAAHCRLASSSRFVCRLQPPLVVLERELVHVLLVLGPIIEGVLLLQQFFIQLILQDFLSVQVLEILEPLLILQRLLRLRHHLLELFHLVHSARYHLPRLLELLLHFLSVSLDLIDVLFVLLLKLALLVRFLLIKERPKILNQFLFLPLVVVVQIRNGVLRIEVIIQRQRLRNEEIRGGFGIVLLRIACFVKVFQLLLEFLQFFVLFASVLDYYVHGLVLDLLEEETSARLAHLDLLFGHSVLSIALHLVVLQLRPPSVVKLLLPLLLEHVLTILLLDHEVDAVECDGRHRHLPRLHLGVV